MSTAQWRSVVGALGIGCLASLFLWTVRRQMVPLALSKTVPSPGHLLDDRPFEAAMREARVWQYRAMERARHERETIAAWDPAADSVVHYKDWQEQMAQDRDGSLHRAKAAVRRATLRALTLHESYRVTALLALLECESGHHAVELRLARQLMALEPRNERSLLWLRRAARCNGMKGLEQQIDRALVAGDSRSRARLPAQPFYGRFEPRPSGGPTSRGASSEETQRLP